MMSHTIPSGAATSGGSIVLPAKGNFGSGRPLRRWQAERAQQQAMQHCSWHCSTRQLCTMVMARDTQQLATLTQGPPPHHAAGPLQPSPGPTDPSQVQHSSTFSSQASVYRSVKRLQDARRTMEALEVLQQGLAQFPTDRHMLSLASSLLVSTNQLQAAAGVLHKAVQLYPKHIPLVTAAAMLEMRMQHYDNAVALIKAGLSRSPSNPVLLQVWGKVEAASGNTGAARSLFAESIQAQPNLPHAYASWAQLEVDRGNIQQARALYQEAVNSVGPHAPLLHAWGSLELELGCWSSAKQLLDASLKSDQLHIPTYQKLGHLEWCQGNLTAAREWWQRGCNTPSGPCPHLLCFWARHELRVHNGQAARMLLESALSVQPEFSPAKVLLAMLADRSGANEAARQLYNSMLPGAVPVPTDNSQQPHSSPASSTAPGTTTGTEPAAAVRQTGTTASAGGQSSQHRSNISNPSSTVAATAVSSNGNSNGGAVDAGGALAVMVAACQYLTRQGHEEAAQKLLSKAEQLAPNNGFLCHLRGLACQQEGDMTGAMAWFRRGTHASVKDGCLLCWEGMAELLSFMGQADIARRTWATGAARAARPTYWHPATPAQVHPHLHNHHNHHNPQHDTNHNHQQPSRAVDAGSIADVLQPVRQQLLAHLGPSSSHGTSADGDGGASSSMPQHSGGGSDTTDHVIASNPAVSRASPAPEGTSKPLGDGTVGVVAAGNSMLSQPVRPTRPASSPGRTPGDNPGAGVSSGSSQAGDTLDCELLLGWPYRDRMSGATDGALYVGVTSRYLRRWALYEKKAGCQLAAEQLFEAASMKDPQDYQTWLAWAVFERRRGQLGAAADLFRRGVSVAPRNPHLWCAYANMLWRQQGDVNAAREALRRATSLCPRSVHLWLEWALLEWRGAGNPRTAMQLLRRGASVPGGRQHELLMQAWEQLKSEAAGMRSRHREDPPEDTSGHANAPGSAQAAA